MDVADVKARETIAKYPLLFTEITKLPLPLRLTPTFPSRWTHKRTLPCSSSNPPLPMKPIRPHPLVCRFPLPMHIVFAFFFLLSSISASVCNPKNIPKRQDLRADQLTILISGYSESRLPLLRSLSASYASSPSIAAVLILWCNPETPSNTLSQFLPPSIASTAPISVHRSSSTSLNARFLPRRSIPTRAVAICDDDVEIDPASLEFSFKIWRSNPDRLVGFFARSHDYDLEQRSWIYTVRPDRFSIVLTKFMILDVKYLWKYSCSGEDNMAAARLVVDEMRNCEDILMNFVVAEASGAGPILVGGKKVRDWGDARNERGERMRDVGLSTREGHRKMRGECIREFHKVFDKMPLKYSYGKIVGDVGEQGLCEKGGKLVFCDEQVRDLRRRFLLL